MKLSDTDATLLCEHFPNQEDAQAEISLKARGSCRWRWFMVVVLPVYPGAEIGISHLQSAHDLHLRVNGASGEADMIFRVSDLVELDEISHPIYRNADIITTRAKAEIDLHTHAKRSKDILLRFPPADRSSPAI